MTQYRYRIELRVDPDDEWKDTGMTVHHDGRVSFIPNVPIESAYFGALHVSERGPIDELALLRQEVADMKHRIRNLAGKLESASYLARGIKDIERRGMT